MDGRRPRATSRVAALDGLRGITIILVVINHAWILWPRDQIDKVPIVRGIFQGGSVVVFFVIGGFIVTLTLLREQARGILDPLRFYLRRIVRIGVQLLPACLAILVIHRVDPTDPFSDSTTTRSIINVLTYTWNQYAINHVFEARSDLGHLWYLSVQQQCYLVLPLLLIVFARRRRVLALLLVAAAAAVVAHRLEVVATDGWYRASLATTTRSDGLILGVVAALGLGYASRWSRRADLTALLASIALLGLLVLSGEIDPLQYLRAWGVAFTLVSVALVVALYYCTEGSWASRLYSVPALQYLGRASLAIYVWHLIIFETVARHTTTWEWEARSVLSFALLAVVTVAAQRFIEDPTRNWLRRSSAFRAPAAQVEAGVKGADGGIR
ncbi:Peptidoglycan/LPS O-acetylase OafA/YrhL, contains acyltransferase and SGNH-hydrolase domains [Pedococcus dokdonensis]|uniref:Peptidoglycan/LPS O-acetylase OafA/YrhL, contains acyltransferase and SGNH-hydrolase domains n=1 Tax=Pedococcus dokdonensis TaxID=443156 RepID=A0A1H0PBR0_9MICO|nr:acyltransferase [Pedococcus dokdonensis]SDP02089.1 Peptidoglycan/LPS O-acetylase OafA/YrhL, contains acyltransferase and SGNH-hydrolase domains [Pedococcus dokdonensis]